MQKLTKKQQTKTVDELRIQMRKAKEVAERSKKLRLVHGSVRFDALYEGYNQMKSVAERALYMLDLNEHGLL